MCPSKGNQHGISIQSFINLRNTFFRISCIWNITQTWFLVRLFVYISSFISQIWDSLYTMVCIYNGLHFFFDGLTEKQRVNCLPHPKHITCFGNSENSCFFLRPLLPSACYAGCEKWSSERKIKNKMYKKLWRIRQGWERRLLFSFSCLHLF